MSPSRSRRTTGTEPQRLDGAQALLGLPGVGPTTAARLVAAGLERVEQLATFAPRRYDDAGQLRPIASIRPGERVYVEGVVERASVRRFFRRATLEVSLIDEGARLLLRWFRFRGEVPARFAVGRRVRAAGLARAGKRGLELIQPIAEAVEEAARLQAAVALRPRYAAVDGVAGARVEKLCVLASCARLPEPGFVPSGLPSLAEAVRAVHLQPPPVDPEARAALMAGSAPAQRRLAFEELLLLRLRAQRAVDETAAPVRVDRATLDRFVAALPFSPTAAQRRELEAIADALRAAAPMRRLLTGDVGSGKTLCAAGAFELCVAGGGRGAFLAPTLLLAEQQAAVLRTLLPGRRVALLTSATRAAERRALAAALGDPRGDVDVVVGTHALLDDELRIAGLALLVVDEQQRFGVVARALLVERARAAGAAPHQLALSATPIPRTLALALRGALSVGRLDEHPPGRGAIKTELYTGARALLRALEAAEQALAGGGRVYWVCPFIDQGAGGGGGRGVIEAAAWLEQRLGEAVEICHGERSADERRAALAAFRAGEVRVLCATTIVEVGLDVAQATLMVIEGPERLGLSALHQLRGRVGRGADDARCVLCAPQAGAAERARLELLVGTRDGLLIAEADLQRRGMGDLGGVAQSGLPALPPLPQDELLALIGAADETARRILERDPQLGEEGHARLRRALDGAEKRGSYDSA